MCFGKACPVLGAWAGSAFAVLGHLSISVASTSEESRLSACCGMAQDGTGLLDLMALVTEDELDIMQTLDAEVRADVEAAARLLARQVQATG